MRRTLLALLSLGGGSVFLSTEESMKKITEHEGKKYLREIRSCLTGEKIQVDVYDVIRAFGVTCPAQAHVIKKLLCAGKRGKGSELDDLIGADGALSRAIEECKRDKEEVEKPSGKCKHGLEISLNCLHCIEEAGGMEPLGRKDRIEPEDAAD